VPESVAIVDAPELASAVVAVTASWEEFPRLWPVLLDEVYAVVARESAGLNVMLYKDDKPSVEVGVLLSGAFSAAGRVVASHLPTGKAACATHRGPYEALEATHRAVRDYCAGRGLRLAGPRWEIYGHWHEDPAELETEVSYLLA
jgi:effector-binding domain-containing protein